MPLRVTVKSIGSGELVIEIQPAIRFPLLARYLEKREATPDVDPFHPDPGRAAEVATLLRSLPAELAPAAARMLGGELCWEAAACS